MQLTQHMGQERRKKDDEALCGAKCNVDNLVWSRSDVTCWKCVHLLLGRPLPPEPVCPEHTKLQTAKTGERDATQLIGEFLDWLENEEKVVLARRTHNRGTLVQRNGGWRELIARFFGINEAALEAEKVAMLAYSRAFHEAMNWVTEEGRPFLQKNP